MTAYGNSAGRRAAVLRARARGGLWRRLLTRLGLASTNVRAAREAAAWEAGADGEYSTAAQLATLKPYGWTVLNDRAIPGAHSANADHVVISPGGRVYLVDSKMWSAKTGPVHGAGGRLWHGPYDRGGSLRSLAFERALVEKALQAPVTALIAVHRAPVQDDGFFVDGVPVVPADRLVMLLVANDGPRSPGAVWLAREAERLLPPYR
ncbi:nuclease-related domain-containing protein [Streptomyces griseorubiginosus]|uniref:nuclease-related domain-containing protein n=1 Tax=Streptomyces griseorubiginosus TaxID=67304 RepID=UPI0033C93F5A